MRLKLTDITLKNLKAASDVQLEVFDVALPSFGVRVTPRGTKSFFLAYRVDRQQRRYTLGRWPDLSLGKARAMARDAIMLVRDGKDPQRVKGYDRRSGKPGFDVFIDEFISKYCKPRNRTWAETERLLKREFGSHWGARPIDRISRADVHSALEVIIARDCPTLANNALVAARKLFNWAVEKGYLEVSPCDRIRAPSPTVTSDRVLNNSEIKVIWKYSDEIGYPYRDFLKLLMLTAQRRSEVAEMRWSELNLKDEVWEIPGQRTKNGKSHTVPLSTTAVSILNEVPRYHETLVFPARGRENPISGFAKWKLELDRLCKIEHWRHHDLRRTAATNMARLKVPPYVVEKILNHTSGTLGGVAGIYNRYAYFDEMGDALQKWDDHLIQVTST